MAERILVTNVSRTLKSKEPKQYPTLETGFCSGNKPMS